MQNQTSLNTYQQYTRAAYSFARSLLWPGVALTADAIDDAHKALSSHFASAQRPEILVRQFYSRVLEEFMDRSMLGPACFYKLLKPKGKKALTYYAITLNERNEPGRRIANFITIVNILTENHLAYVAKPSPSILYKCKAELEKIGEGRRIRIFYTAVQTQPFSRN